MSWYAKKWLKYITKAAVAVSLDGHQRFSQRLKYNKIRGIPSQKKFASSQHAFATSALLCLITTHSSGKPDCHSIACLSTQPISRHKYGPLPEGPDS